jgi:hypothetical protein
MLLSQDLFLELFPWLDRGSKVALRLVSRAMCSLVDGSISAVTAGSIETVASPAAGFSDCAALVRWIGVRDLTLVLVVDGSASDLKPLDTTSLPRRAPGGHVCMGAWAHAHAWLPSWAPHARPAHECMLASIGMGMAWLQADPSHAALALDVIILTLAF